MPFLALGAVVLALVAIALVRPDLRPQALMICAAVCAVIAAGFVANRFLNPPPPDLTAEDLDLQDVTLEDFRAGGRQIVGRVQNLTETMALTSFELTLRMHDCPEPTDIPEACPILAEDRSIARAAVPPGQIRPFSATFILASLPRVTGEMRWSFEIGEIRGQAAQP